MVNTAPFGWKALVFSNSYFFFIYYGTSQVHIKGLAGTSSWTLRYIIAGLINKDLQSIDIL